MVPAWKELRGYAGPSDPRRNRLSPFFMRKFWQVHVRAVEPHIRRGDGRRQWFHWRSAERRNFEINYGYNPRCSHQGTWGKPGTFHWKRKIARYDNEVY